MICMFITWLVMLKQTPETFIGTTIVGKKDTMKRRNGNGDAQSDLEKVEEFHFTDMFNKNEHTQVPLLDRFAFEISDNILRNQK